VNGRSLVVSNGRVYFRSREAFAARHTVRSMRETLAGPPGSPLRRLGSPSLTEDGRLMVFGDLSLSEPDDVCSSTIGNLYLHDLRAVQTSLVPVPETGTAFFPRISPRSGQFIAYQVTENADQPFCDGGAGFLAVYDRARHESTTANVDNFGRLIGSDD